MANVGIEVNDRLQAKYADGEFYPATVVEVSKSQKRKKAPVKVTYKGYGPEEDRWLPLDSLKSRKLSSMKDIPAPKAKAKGKAKAAAKAPAKAKATPKSKAKAKAEPQASAKSLIASLAKGDQLQADYEGTWCKATVVATSTAKTRAKAPVKVHYTGYGDECDAWVSLDKLKSKKLKAASSAPPAKEKAAPKAKAKAKAEPAPAKKDVSALEPGMRLQAEYEGTMYAAEVVAVSAAKARAKAPVKVKFTGHDGEYWMSVDKLKSKAIKAAPAAPATKQGKAAAASAPATPGMPEKGAKVQAEFEGKFYPAEVVLVSTAKARKKAPIKVHYVGQPDEFDTWLAVDKVKFKAKKGKAAPAEAKEKKAAPAKAAEPDFKSLKVGSKVQAEWEGVFYAAEVLAVSSAKNRKAAPVKVHFVGRDASDDSWIAVDKLKSKLLKGKAAAAKAAPAPKAAAAPSVKDVLKKLSAGSKLQAAFTDGKFYPAEVVVTSTAKNRAKAPVKVSFVGFGAEFDTWCSLDKLKSKLIPKDAGAKAAPAKAEKGAKADTSKSPYSVLEKGMKLQAEYEGAYYAAEVMAVSTAAKRKKAPVQVKFIGQGDEGYWLGGDSLRCKALTAALKKAEKKGEEKPAAKAAAKGKAKSKAAAKAKGKSAPKSKAKAAPKGKGGGKKRKA